jgi:hypothetical protein
MKFLHIIFCFGFLLMVQNLLAQPKQVIKNYAYSRLITGGAQMLDVNGNPVDKNRNEYIVFLEVSKKYKPLIQNIWINGIEYNAQLEYVKKLPVIFHVSSSEKINLVPITKNDIWQILLTPKNNQIQPTKRIADETKSNAVVINFKSCNKRLTIKSLKELPTLVAP